MKFEWEVIDFSVGNKTERAKVIDGWLVRTFEEGVGMALIFMEDPDHDWELEK